MKLRALGLSGGNRNWVSSADPWPWRSVGPGRSFSLLESPGLVRGPWWTGSLIRPPPPAPSESRGQCVEHFGAGEAYLPVLEALGRLCRATAGKEAIGLLCRCAPTWLIQMPGLISDQELEAAQHRVHGTTHERMLRELTEVLEAYPP